MVLFDVTHQIYANVPTKRILYIFVSLPFSIPDHVLKRRKDDQVLAPSEMKAADECEGNGEEGGSNK